MPEKPPRPYPLPKTTIGCAVTIAEARRLHALAEQKNISLSRLMTQAIQQVYPAPEKPGEG